MTTFEIVNTRSGVSLGMYPGVTEEEAIQAMLDDAQCGDLADLDLVATPVEETSA